MPVYDQSYKHWEGSFKSHTFRWWVITKYGIKTAFKKKAVKVLFMLAIVPFIAFAVYIYGLTHLGKVAGFVSELGGDTPLAGMGGKTYEVEVEGDPAAFLQGLSKEALPDPGQGPTYKITLPDEENSNLILAIADETGTKIARMVPPGVRETFYSRFLNVEARYLFLLLLVIGAGLIAKDVKFNALQIYLAKPITGLDYVVGKLGVLLFFLVMVTMVPGIILFLFQAILIGDSLYFRHYWWVPAAICGYSLLIVFSGSLVILALSSFSRNVRNAAAGGAAVFWFTPMVANILRYSTHNDSYMLVSLRDNWTSVGNRIFSMERSFDVPWGWSLLILLTLIVLCAGALARRVRGVEVVK